MPMSEEWRSSMREKLKQVDYESLSAEQKERYREMMFQLNGGKSGSGGGRAATAEDDGDYPLQRYGLVLAIAAFLLYQHWQGQRAAGGGAAAGGAAGTGGPVGGGTQQPVGGGGTKSISKHSCVLRGAAAGDARGAIAEFGKTN
eukprot:g9764.t1